MSELATIARPYAKAAFDFAIEHQSVSHWQTMLTFCAEVSRNEQIVELFSGAFSSERLAKIFISICGKILDVAGQNLIRIMAENRRLMVLQNVLEKFILLRAEQEMTMEVDVISVSALKERQLEKISAIMEHRLSRKIKLNCKIDESVLAGVVIRAGDTVIDGSIRSRLERLEKVLLS